ncbi:TonB-dependent receptor [Phenylobacterium sp.]|uniref:TonB-dependent receptor n=1 Tax=Phenylobacterium sp. TaxID=1871053 RepID=UPI0035ADA328
MTSKRHLLAGCAACALIAIASSSTAAAQQPPEPATHEIETVVVTAQKRAENVQDVPLAITAVSGERLAAAHVDTLQELRYLDPSVSYSQSTSPRSSGFRIRGVGTSSFSTGIEQSVSTVVDGVVLSDPSAAQSLLDVDHVEILRGPQGMLFGKNASAGVVSITTRNPVLQEFGGYGKAAAGARGEALVQGVANVPLSESAAVRVGASYRHLDATIKNRVTGEGVDTTDIRTVQAKLLWRPSDRFRAILAGTYSYAPNFCCVPSWRVVTPGYITDYGNRLYGVVAGPNNTDTATDFQPDGYSKSYGSSLTLDFSVGDYDVTSITGWQESHGRAIFDGDQMAFNYLSYNGSVQSYRNNTQELRIASPIGGPFDFVAGLYYYQAWTNGTIYQMGYLQTLTPPATSPTPQTTLRSSARAQHVSSQSEAAFAQGNWHPTRRLTLIGGLRYTHDDLDLLYDNQPFAPGSIAVTNPPISGLRQSVTNDNVSWRLGAQYDLAADTMLYATVSSGYKGPGFSATTVSSPQQDQRVGPETSLSYEAGIRSELLDRRWLVNATIYHVRYKGFQAQVQDINSTQSAAVIKNAGDLTTAGFELSSQYRPIPELNLSASLAYTDATFGDFAGVSCYVGQPQPPCGPPPLNPSSSTRIFNAEGERLPGTPKWSYSLGVNYRKQSLVGGLTGDISADWNWQSSVIYATNGDPGTVQEAFGLLGGEIGLGPDDERWRISIFGRNLLDERWAAVIGAAPVQSANPKGYYQWFSPDSFRRVGIQFQGKF